MSFDFGSLLSGVPLAGSLPIIQSLTPNPNAGGKQAAFQSAIDRYRELSQQMRPVHEADLRQQLSYFTPMNTQLTKMYGQNAQMPNPNMAQLFTPPTAEPPQPGQPDPNVDPFAPRPGEGLAQTLARRFGGGK